jgi:hypothetical protein
LYIIYKDYKYIISDRKINGSFVTGECMCVIKDNNSALNIDHTRGKNGA